MKKTDFKPFEVCLNCIFWDNRKSENANEGVCVKNSPQTRTKAGLVKWPSTYFDDKCGQYSSNEVTKVRELIACKIKFITNSFLRYPYFFFLENPIGIRIATCQKPLEAQSWMHWHCCECPSCSLKSKLKHWDKKEIFEVLLPFSRSADAIEFGVYLVFDEPLEIGFPAIVTKREVQNG